MNKKDEFDGFTVNLFLDEDGDYLAHFNEMPSISAFADTPEAALHELAEAWKLVKQSYTDDRESVPVAPSRRQYSGRFNVRIDKRLHRALAIEAARNGVSLNALVARKLSEDSARFDGER